MIPVTRIGNPIDPLANGKLWRTSLKPQACKLQRMIQPHNAELLAVSTFKSSGPALGLIVPKNSQGTLATDIAQLDLSPINLSLRIDPFASQFPADALGEFVADTFKLARFDLTERPVDRIARRACDLRETHS